MQVHVVTQGHYSDYRIVAMFSTKEAAEKCVELLKSEHGKWNDIETWEVDSWNTNQRVIKGWVVRIRKDTGEIITTWEYHCLSDEWESIELHNEFRVLVEGDDEDHAKKVAIEKRQAWLRERTEVKS